MPLAVLDAVPTPIVWVTPPATVAYANRAARAWLGEGGFGPGVSLRNAWPDLATLLDHAMGGVSVAQRIRGPSARGNGSVRVHVEPCPGPEGGAGCVVSVRIEEGGPADPVVGPACAWDSSGRCEAAENAERLRDVAEAAQEWFWETGPDHRFTWFLCSEILPDDGIRPWRALGMDRAALFDTERESPERIESLQADLDAHRPFRDLTYWMRRLDGEGEARLLRSSGKPRFDARGRFLGYRGAATDITREAEVEARARRAETRLMDALNNMADGFVLWDAEDRLVLWNRAYETLLPELAPVLREGATFDDIIARVVDGRAVVDTGTPGSPVVRVRGPAALEACRAHHGRAKGTLEMCDESGRWLVISERRTHDDQVLTTISDMTWRKRMETELARSEAGLRAFHAITTHPGLRLIERLEEVLALGMSQFGLPNGVIARREGTRPEILAAQGPAFAGIGPPHLPPAHQSYCVEVLRRDGPLAIPDAAVDETWCHHPAWTVLGRRAYLGIPVTQGHERVGTLAFFGSDAHPAAFSDAEIQLLRLMAQWVGGEIARHEAERAQDEALEQALVANRSKTEFLANMSHELRTPLNAILGFSEVMAEEIMGPLGSARYRDYARGIHDSGAHLLSIINDILDVSKIEAGQMVLGEERVALGPLIDSALRLVSGRAAEGGVRLNAGPRDGLVRGDGRRLKQVLLNVLSNAVKFTPEGGWVDVEVMRPGPGADLDIVIKDTGIGMSAEDIAIALKPFGQIDSGLARRHEGTGLGLPLARALTEMHGGRLLIASEPGEGTEVRVRLPAGRIEAGSEPLQGHPAPLAAPSSPPVPQRRARTDP
ncbi:ATP-binding protein [Pararhodospirillum oryzae]|nr:ATP-binding protein [Pararhodospirillum oryzae]